MADQFDPSQPFTTEQASASPAFDPNKPFEVAEAPQFDPSKPFEAAPSEEGGLITGKPLTDADLRAIAEKRGLSPQQAVDLRQDVGWMGGASPIAKDETAWQAAKESLKTGAGTIGKGVLLGIPQKVYRSLQAPEYEQALDDLNELIHRKRSYAEAFGEMAPGVVAGLGMAGAAERALPAAAAKVYDIAAPIAGATTAGVGESKKGEELAEAAKGAAVGAAIAGAVPITKGVYRYFAGAEKPIAEEAAKRIKVNEKYIGEEVEKKLVTQSKELAERDRLVLTPDGQKELLDADKTLDNWPADQELPESLSKLQPAIDDLNQLANHIENPNIEVPRSDLSVKKALGIIREEEAKQGPEYVATLLKNKRYENLGIEAHLEKGLGEDYGLVKDNFEKIIDGQFKGRMIERRLGLPVVQTLMDTSKQLKRFSISQDAMLSKLENLERIPTSDYAAVSRAIEEDKVHLLPEHLQPFAKSYKKLWEDGLKTVQDMGIPVQKMEGYVRHATLPADEAMGKMGLAMHDLEKQWGHSVNDKTITDENIHALMESTPLFKELVKSVEYLGGKQNEIAEMRTGAASAFFKDLREAMNPQYAKEGRGITARAAQERKLKLPDLIREHNPYRLYNGWVQNTLKTAYLREPLQKLITYRNVAIKSNLKNDADYLNNLIIDLSSGRRKTFGNNINDFLNASRAKARMAAAAKGNPNISEWANLSDDILRTTSGQVYSNYLGLNPASLVQNLMQPVTQTIPELGHRYGALTGAKAGVRMLNILKNGEEITLSREGASLLNKQMAKGIESGKIPPFEVGQKYTTRSPSVILENAGQKTKQISREMGDYMLSEMTKTNVLKAPMRMLRKANDALMYFYENSEAYNRLFVREIASEMSRDLMKGAGKLSDLAHTAVAREFPESIKHALQRGIQAGDERGVQTILTDYLHNKTLYNYDKANLSAVARYLGPLFTAFTKFPLSIAGDMYEKLVAKGAARGGFELLRKYAPLPIALYGLDKWTGITDPEKNPRIAQLVGRGGLAGTTPIMGLKSVLQGRMGPPAIHQAFQGALALAQLPTGNLQPTWAWINTVAKSYLPGSRFYGIITDDIPTLVKGEKPQGTFIGKGIPGLDEAIKGAGQKAQETLYNK